MANFLTTTSLQTLMIGTTFDTATTALAAKAMTWAENEIFKYLSKRYDVSSFDSIGSTPPLLSSLGDDLACGFMYKHMARGGKDAFLRAKEMIDPVIANLKEIRDYKEDLIDSTGSVVIDFSDTAYRVLDNTSDYAETFNEDDPLNWQIDEDKLDDIEDERE